MIRNGPGTVTINILVKLVKKNGRKKKSDVSAFAAAERGLLYKIIKQWCFCSQFSLFCLNGCLS